MKNFYRTLITIEILSEEPYTSEDLETISYDIDQGDCSGMVTIAESETVDGAKMAELLMNQGSDPGFFRLDDEGEDLIDD